MTSQVTITPTIAGEVRNRVLNSLMNPIDSNDVSDFERLFASSAGPHRLWHTAVANRYSSLDSVSTEDIMATLNTIFFADVMVRIREGFDDPQAQEDTQRFVDTIQVVWVNRIVDSMRFVLDKDDITTDTTIVYENAVYEDFDSED